MLKETRLEIIFKGIANKNRLRILLYLHKKPESTVGKMSEIIKLNIRTASDHITKMMLAGLIMKRNESLIVRLALTKRGTKLAQYILNLN